MTGPRNRETPTPYYQDDAVTLYHGDCRDILPNLDKADLIFTDPPYPKEFDYVWGVLAEHAPRVLGRGKSLITYLGHYQIPHVLAVINGPMRFNWLCIQRNLGANPRIFGFRALVAFKPLLWFSNGAIERGPFLCDELPFDHVGRSRTKGDHEWAQPVSRMPILRLTAPGDVVLDPFAGAGSVLVAAKSCGRRAIGVELEERYCEVAAQRLMQEVLPVGECA